MKDESTSWGLAACGSAGGLFIEVLHSFTVPEKWQLSFNFPTTQLWLQVEGPSTVLALFQFLGDTYQTRVTRWMKLGSCFSCAVIIVKDEEFEDRYFIHIQGKEDCDERSDYLQLTLIDQRTSDFIAALGQVVDNLKDE